MKKRLLAITVIGAALLLSTVLIVSLKGNDKPEITTNPPEDEQPASTPQPAVYFSNDLDDYDYKVKRHYTALIPQTAPSNPEDDDEDDDDADEGNGNGNGNGQSDAKTHGLERAIEVHLRNMERQDAKMNENAKSHDSNGKGIENSMAHLQENLEKQESRT